MKVTILSFRRISIDYKQSLRVAAEIDVQEMSNTGFLMLVRIISGSALR